MQANTVKIPPYRNPTDTFEEAIKQGRLSTNESAHNWAGNYMYMGDDSEGNAMFKNIVSRNYLPALTKKAANFRTFAELSIPNGDK